MKRFTSERGAGHLVAVLLVLVVAVVGFAGYSVLKSQDKKTTSTAVSTQKKVDAVPVLKEADATLTQTDSELESSLDTSALDQDIDAML
jgi:uncharacterized protein HemX